MGGGRVEGGESRGRPFPRTRRSGALKRAWRHTHADVRAGFHRGLPQSCSMLWWRKSRSRCDPPVAMMEPAELRHRDDTTHRWRLDIASHRRVAPERHVGAVRVVVRDVVVAEKASRRRRLYSIGGSDSPVTSAAIRVNVAGGVRDRLSPGRRARRRLALSWLLTSSAVVRPPFCSRGACRRAPGSRRSRPGAGLACFHRVSESAGRSPGEAEPC